MPEKYEIMHLDGTLEPTEQEKNAHHVVAQVIDVFTAWDVPLPSSYKGRVAKAAKGLLEDGFDWQLLVIAAVIAIRRGEPSRFEDVAADMAMARAGQRMTRREYEIALQDEMEIGAWRK